MSKTYQVMNVDCKGIKLICIYDTTAKWNPYKLYQKSYDNGWHRKKITEYTDFQSVLYHLVENYDFRR